MSNWLTPPDLFARLDAEFGFDFDPCPYPRPEGYDSLVLPWGQSNYVNPPFNRKDAPFGGPSAFARKAIAEAGHGKTSVLILPVPHSIGILLQAGAEVRDAGIVRWLDTDTGEPAKRKAPQALFIVRPRSDERLAGRETRLIPGAANSGRNCGQEQPATTPEANATGPNDTALRRGPSKS